MKNWLFDNFWIKVASLVLAVATWFYVNGELDKQKRMRDKTYKPPTIEQTAGQPSSETKQMHKGRIKESR